MKSWRLATLLIMGLFMVGMEIIPLYAHAADADDDYNFSWLDPDKKIYVLQNRKYRKAKKVELSVLGGIGLAETYRNAYQVEGRLGYWFNEDFGLEGFYSQWFNSPNGAYDALTAFNTAQGVGGGPAVREVNNEIGALFNWAPWYAKINVFNTILYFDWYLSLGAGIMNTQVGELTQATAPATWHNESLFAVYFGTGQLFHLSQTFDLRLEILGHFYSADINGGQPGLPVDRSIYSNFSFKLGVGVRL